MVQFPEAYWRSSILKKSLQMSRAYATNQSILIYSTFLKKYLFNKSVYKTLKMLSKLIITFAILIIFGYY